MTLNVKDKVDIQIEDKETRHEEEMVSTEIDSKEKKKTKAKKSVTKSLDKIKKLEEKISGLEDEKKALKDQALRKMAEFENYKRRTEKEFLALLENANEGLISDLLPVIDDFERSLAHAKESDNGQSLLEGVELIYKKLIDLLNKKGLKIMESVGHEFDPEKHQALMQVDLDKYESGYIVEEHLKGYLLNDKVIRHAQVLVNK